MIARISAELAWMRRQARSIARRFPVRYPNAVINTALGTGHTRFPLLDLPEQFASWSRNASGMVTKRPTAAAKAQATIDSLLAGILHRHG